MASNDHDPVTGGTVAPRGNRDVWVASACGVLVAGMVGMAYAAVPLYDWFCRTTGFGGTTQVSQSAPAHSLERTITVRFDSNMAPGLPWRFEPEVTSIDAKIGDVVTVNYTVTNLTARATAGVASYNVTPLNVGSYFHKINCFCFSEQRLKPGEKTEMTVVFYVDPQIAKDAEQDGLNTITLSYTFHPVREQPQRGAAVKAAPSADDRS